MSLFSQAIRDQLLRYGTNPRSHPRNCLPKNPTMDHGFLGWKNLPSNVWSLETNPKEVIHPFWGVVLPISCGRFRFFKGDVGATFPKPRFGFEIFWSLQMVQMRLILILFTICHGLLVAKVFRDFIDPWNASENTTEIPPPATTATVQDMIGLCFCCQPKQCTHFHTTQNYHVFVSSLIPPNMGPVESSGQIACFFSRGKREVWLAGYAGKLREQEERWWWRRK